MCAMAGQANTVMFAAAIALLVVVFIVAATATLRAFSFFDSLLIVQ